MSGRFSTGGRVGFTAASKARAFSSAGKRQTTCASSAVQSSIPGRTASPVPRAASMAAPQLPQAL